MTCTVLVMVVAVVARVHGVRLTPRRPAAASVLPPPPGFGAGAGGDLLGLEVLHPERRPVGCSGKGRKIMSSGAGCVIVVTPVESRHPASCRVSLITRFLRVFSVAAAPPITESFLRNGACRCWWCCVIQLAIHYKKCASHKSDIFYCSRLDEF
jgi:hypothetical protein